MLIARGTEGYRADRNESDRSLLLLLLFPSLLLQFCFFVRCLGVNSRGLEDSGGGAGFEQPWEYCC